MVGAKACATALNTALYCIATCKSSFTSIHQYALSCSLFMNEAQIGASVMVRLVLGVCYLENYLQ